MIILDLFGKLRRRQIDHLGAASWLGIARVGILAFRLGLDRRLLVNHRLRATTTRLALGMLRLAFLGRVDRRLMQAVVMIRKLRIGLGGDPFTGGGGVMRQRQIFLVQLLRVATQLHIRPVGFI